MDFIKSIVEFIFHLDKHLNFVIQYFGVWSYAILFLIIFAETGLVVTPFLPGDSLLFAVGAFSATGSFNVLWIFAILSLAAIVGDSINYAAGKFIGEKIFREDARILKKEYLDKTHKFYEKYGGKTIVIARFVPIVRTFAPFVAGVGKMSYLYFFTYNVIGGLLWVSLFVFGGFLFGNIPLIKQNFTVVIFIIIFLSMLPGIIEIWKHKRAKTKL